MSVVATFLGIAMASTPIAVSGDVTPFDRALSFTLHWEGGYVNHPADSGGATNMGITQAVYATFRQQSGLPAKDVRNISRGEVAMIYRERYWNALDLDRYHGILALVLFDTAVNFGVGRTRAFLRLMAPGAKSPLIGGPDLSPLMKAGFQTEVAALAFQVIGMRRAWRYQRVIEAPSQEVFLRGWLRRDEALDALVRSQLGVLPL